MLSSPKHCLQKKKKNWLWGWVCKSPLVNVCITCHHESSYHIIFMCNVLSSFSSKPCSQLAKIFRYTHRLTPYFEIRRILPSIPTKNRFIIKGDFVIQHSLHSKQKWEMLHLVTIYNVILIFKIMYTRNLYIKYICMINIH